MSFSYSRFIVDFDCYIKSLRRMSSVPDRGLVGYYFQWKPRRMVKKLERIYRSLISAPVFIVI